ncbi:MAG: oligoribonuclease [Candidatus Nanopelagicales bacterium]|nr:oligoribonuclease [Candidatus Nanopelagicales bacterium]MCF8539199.1 oligoribonuclease [Candidatus Nanopelagicales bacterium]MCF8551418.1 oligoribonuclease [Candidatus Nanopelagicales bacterium]
MPEEQQDNTNQRLVWIDLEMTGLSVDNDEIVEIAAIVTDAELTELDAGISLVIKPSQEALNNMDDFVTGMHKDSGLMAELDSGITLEAAQTQVLEYIKSHVPEPNKGHLAGSSVYVDRGFLAKYMPDIDQHLHYRLIDVSSIKELARRWYPKAYFNSPEKTGNHRALADTRESIAELRYYREAIMVAAPGPDGTQAKEIATNHVVEHN